MGNIIEPVSSQGAFKRWTHPCWREALQKRYQVDIFCDGTWSADLGKSSIECDHPLIWGYRGTDG